MCKRPDCDRAIESMRAEASPPRPAAGLVPRPRANYISGCGVYKKRTAVRGRASRTAVGGESENREKFFFAAVEPRYQTNRFLLAENLSENPKTPKLFRSHPFRTISSTTDLYARKSRKLWKSRKIFQHPVFLHISPFCHSGRHALPPGGFGTPPTPISPPRPIS
jgi:hypothetical protein